MENVVKCLSMDQAVDVVIPVRNGERYVAACLDTVVAQTRPASAIIVVDDGSTDATPQILARYADLLPALIVVRTEPRGLACARNAGIRTSKAPFVAFLDSDDLWEVKKLERQMSLFTSHIGFVYCSYYHLDEIGRRVNSHRIVEPRDRSDLFRDLIVEGNIISGSGSSVIVRRDLLEQTGGFDESLRFAEDWDLWIKLSTYAKADFIPEPLVGIRIHGDSMQAGNFGSRTRRFFHLLTIVDRWHERLPPESRKSYRRLAGNSIVASAAAQPLTAPVVLWQFFNDLKHGNSRFGRDLFRNRLDFAGEVVRAIFGWMRRRR